MSPVNGIGGKNFTAPRMAANVHRGEVHDKVRFDGSWVLGTGRAARGFCVMRTNHIDREKRTEKRS